MFCKEVFIQLFIVILWSFSLNCTINKDPINCINSTYFALQYELLCINRDGISSIILLTADLIWLNLSDIPFQTSLT